jgi:signal transduction histidine kinase/CheY-like chemotaxis protein
VTFRNLPIRQKLTFLNVLSSTFVLLLATGAFFAYELVSFRQTMVRKLAAEAELLGTNSASALVFDDRDAAVKTLDALYGEPSVIAAAVYDKAGAPFAAFLRANTKTPPAVLSEPATGPDRWHRFADGTLVVGTPIVVGGERVGSLRIVSDLAERDARLQSYLGIVAAAFFSAILAGIALSSRLQRLISDPIIHLVERARVVTERKDYTIRATPSGDDELGLLIRTFNEMLAQIQARDSALERARDHAESANRAKDEFLAVVSHELRTPLTPIISWARLLKTGKLDDVTRDRAIDVIERNARSQAQLVDDLLDVSRIVAGKVRLDVQTIDLRPLLEAAVEAARPAAAAKGIRLQLILDPRAGAVSGDPQRLQQVAWNLLSNAVKFTPKNGRVQVHLQRVNSHVEIAVSDTGQGIESAFLPHVFERFRQADSTTTRTHGGLGLGLSIVRQIVELHGGRVRVDSPGEGQGATFTVELPTTLLRTPAADRVHPMTPTDVPFEPSATLAGTRVLVVDDERDTLEMLDVLLRQCGADVRMADNAAMGLEMLRHWRPDVMVSDIGMPGEDGYAFIGKVRDLPREEGGLTPAIAVTAYARSEDRVRALSAGFQMHVAKPIEPAELVASVASLTRRSVG